jgi:N-acetylglucosaminyldiphosphoundecaprenol N-acetyl-beta-D-mannosaminyltransferase
MKGHFFNGWNLKMGTNPSCEQLSTCRFLGQVMHPLTMQQTVEVIAERIAQGLFTQHVVVNVAKLVNMRKDRRLRDSVNGCDIINIDGMGVVWGARICGIAVPERVSGIDLFYNLLEMASHEGHPVFFLGARQAVVETAVARIQQNLPLLRIAGWHHGYFWDDEESVVEEIRCSGARLLFVAISSPKKENFINRWKDRLGVHFVMGVGGTFDVVAGKIRRAPVWMQHAGSEWFYRLCQEPGRMWSRYLVTNSLYGALLLREWLVTRRSR